MTTPKLPDCPSCGSNRNVRPMPDRRYWCQGCNVFLDDGEDAGTYSTKDPSWRMQREEERAKRKRQQTADDAALPPGFRRANR